MNKSTTERIEEILNEVCQMRDIDRQILKLELENLVTKAQIEQLEKDKL